MTIIITVISYFRYDEATNELINDELNVAYPISEGIPNMNPHNARKINGHEIND